MTTVTLTAEQLNELAVKVAAHLTQQQPPSSLTDAASVARELGVSRAFVYEHANALGARRLNGKGRLRFDVERAREAFAAMPPLEDTHRPPPRKRRTAKREHILQSRPRRTV
jgi:hypothetical protein